jgi:Domain of unknown function (DUF3943)
MLARLRTLVCLTLLVCAAGARAEPELGPRYDALHRPAPEAHPYRALAEEVLFIGVGTTWYWLEREQNMFDWDKPSARQRFSLSSMRFDNNKFPINFVWHPLSGAAYYAAARTNGLSLLASSGYALGACLAWEYGIEFNEKVSINDLVFTPLPSISLGEFYSRLALYLGRGPGRFGPAKKAVAWSFGLLQTAHDAFDGVSSYTDDEPDALGYGASTHHRFEALVGAGSQSVAGSAQHGVSELRLDGELVSIPRFGRAGRFRRLLRDGDFVRFGLHTVQGAAGQELEVTNDLTLLGGYVQRISDALRGGSIFVGTSLGYRYRKQRLIGFSDDLALTRLPGLALDGLWRSGEVVLRTRIRVHPEFAGVRARAYDDYLRANPDVVPKTTLGRAGYLYAFGVSTRADVELALGAYVSLGALVDYVYLDSVEGLDRNQEELTADPKGVDRVLDVEGSLRVYPLGRARRLLVELGFMQRKRSSTLAGFTRDASLFRSALRVGADF